MKVNNPTKDDIEIVYRGIRYEVKAGEVLTNVPQEAARYWKNMIHHFIVISEDGVEETPRTKGVEEEKEEGVSEVEETPKKVSEEKPKRKRKK